jgi:hypothetical protein
MSEPSRSGLRLHRRATPSRDIVPELRADIIRMRGAIVVSVR